MQDVKLKELIKEFVSAYQRQGNLLLDPFRGGERVEIPAGFALAALQHNVGEDEFIKKLLDAIVQNQDSVGFWLEYPYSEKALQRGFAGTVPTCFAILALADGYRHFKDKTYLDAAVRATEWLYQNEKSGYFLKASLNKSDVINTNLLAAFSLLTVAEFLGATSQHQRLYRFAANRALRRSIASQFFSGAFPYISFGIGVPFLYQAMTTALIGLLAAHIPQGIVRYSFTKGFRYLDRIIDANGRFLWVKTRAKDKEGAIWAYGWAAVCFALSGNQQRLEQMIVRLTEAKKGRFLQSSDFDSREDLFYTSWTLFALAVSSLKPLSLAGRETKDMGSISFSDKVRFYCLALTAFFPRDMYVIKILIRKLFRMSLDKGPAEEW